MNHKAKIRSLLDLCDLELKAISDRRERLDGYQKELCELAPHSIGDVIQSNGSLNPCPFIVESIVIGHELLRPTSFIFRGQRIRDDGSLGLNAARVVTFSEALGEDVGTQHPISLRTLHASIGGKPKIERRTVRVMGLHSRRTIKSPVYFCTNKHYKATGWTVAEAIDKFYGRVREDME